MKTNKFDLGDPVHLSTSSKLTDSRVSILGSTKAQQCDKWSTFLLSPSPPPWRHTCIRKAKNIRTSRRACCTLKKVVNRFLETHATDDFLSNTNQRCRTLHSRQTWLQTDKLIPYGQRSWDAFRCKRSILLIVPSQTHCRILYAVLCIPIGVPKHHEPCFDWAWHAPSLQLPREWGLITRFVADIPGNEDIKIDVKSIVLQNLVMWPSLWVQDGPFKTRSNKIRLPEYVMCSRNSQERPRPQTDAS